MPSLGLSLTKAASAISSYVRDGLKLYMPYNSPKEVKFVGEGSTAFDTADDYVAITPVRFADGEKWSLSFWLNGNRLEHDSSPVQIPFNDPSYGHIAYYSADRVVIYPDDNYDINVNFASISPSFKNNTWYHLTFTCDGDKIYFYRDGIAIANGDPGVTTFGIASFSDSDGSNEFDGSMKNVAIWERTLSPTEIQNVMYKTYTDLSGTLLSGLVGWWALESDYLDKHGSNNASVGGGDPVQTDSFYGGATPLIPRGFDNAPTVQADAIGTGYAVFDGSSHISVADSDNLSFGDDSEDSAFSISAWVKMTDAQSFMIIGKGVVGAGHEWIFYTTDENKIAFYTYDESETAYVGKTYNTSLASYENTWIHLAGTYDATEANSGFKIYLNGIQVDDTNFTGGEGYTAIEAGTSAVHIGRYDSTYADGYMKNIGIWSAVLTQPQIQSIMEKTYSELIASEKSTLVSWWGLDATATNNTVLVLDENATLGSELISSIVNDDTYDFETFTNNGDGSYTIETTTASLDGGYNGFEQPDDDRFAVAVGEVYKLTCTYNNISGTDDLEVNIATGAVGTSKSNISGSNQITLVEGSNTIYILIDSAFSSARFSSQINTVSKFTISNISLKKLTGNGGELK